MKTKTLALFSTALLGLAVFSGPANAASGIATNNVNLRAGPSQDYPVIARIPAGAKIQIDACIRGWNWCDVSWKRNHGWISGKFLKTRYRDRNDYIVNSGRLLRVPVVVFNQDDYWDYYYRDYDFYRDRHRGRDRDRDWNRDRDGDRDRDWRDDDRRGGWGYDDNGRYRFND